MLSLVAESPEVFYALDAMPVVGASEIAFLKEQAAQNPRRRSRLCLHRSPDDVLHEMIIVHHRDAYVRPHRHVAKSESLGVLEGQAAVFTFKDDGRLDSTTLLARSAAKPFHYRMPAQTWHSLGITSEWFVFIETTQGPFDRRMTEFAPWAPDGCDHDEATRYMRLLASTNVAPLPANESDFPLAPFSTEMLRSQ